MLLRKAHLLSPCWCPEVPLEMSQGTQSVCMQGSSSVHPPVHAATVKLAYVPGGEAQLVGGALHETPPLPPAAHLVSMYTHVKVIYL